MADRSRRGALTATVAGTLLALVACADPSPSPAPDRGPPEPAGDPASAGTPTASAASAPAEAAPRTAAGQAALDARLLAAAWRHDLDGVRRLLARGADLDRRDDTRQNTFLVAASEGYADLLELAIRRGADVSLHDSFDGTALIRAGERGHWQVVGRLLRPDVRRAVGPDHVNNLGWTALHEAVVLGTGLGDDATTVRVLVAGGVDLDVPAGRDGLTARQQARERGQLAVVTTLDLASGPAPADPDRALLRAASAGDADAVALALRAGADLEARDERRRTPLLLAATRDHVEVARVLLALGASPDALDDRHDTPWLVTGVTGSVRMADTMLRFGPDLTIRNRFGGLSLIPASERGHVDYVRRVAGSGIDVDHVNDLGWTALLEAVILGDGSPRYAEVVRLLLAAGADPAIADGDGVTPLTHARSRDFTALARLLARAER